VSLCNWWH